MTARITFRSEIYINGDTLEEIKNKWEAIPLFSEKAKADCAEFVELVSVEDEETYDDLMHEFNDINWK